MGYSEKELKIIVEDGLKEIESFYSKPFVNYKGRTTDEKNSYTEIVAEMVLKNWDKFEDIKSNTRKNSYKVGSHIGNLPKETSNRNEERIAIQLFNQKFLTIGEIIDYQTPLKNISADNYGKVDLLMKSDSCLYFLELKDQYSEESLLRCILEGYTYSKIADTDKLLKDFGLDESLSVKSAPLIFKGSTPYKHLNEERLFLNKLMKKIKQEVFIIEIIDSNFIVSKY